MRAPDRKRRDGGSAIEEVFVCTPVLGVHGTGTLDGDLPTLPATIRKRLLAGIYYLGHPQRMKTGAAASLQELKRAMESNPGFQFPPLDFAQLEEFAALAAIREPFDRLIVSAAKSIRGVLITRDRSLADGDFVQTVWA